MTHYRETDTRFDGNLDYTFEDLDTSWLSEFEKMNKENQICYTENLLFVLLDNGFCIISDHNYRKIFQKVKKDK